MELAQPVDQVIMLARCQAPRRRALPVCHGSTAPSISRNRKLSRYPRAASVKTPTNNWTTLRFLLRPDDEIAHAVIARDHLGNERDHQADADGVAQPRQKSLARRPVPRSSERRARVVSPKVRPVSRIVRDTAWTPAKVFMKTGKKVAIAMTVDFQRVVDPGVKE